MPTRVILASGSDIRHRLLQNAGVEHEVIVPRLDEDQIRAAMLADRAPPRDIADALAEAKARKISAKHADALVIGCDQVLDFDGAVLGKPETPADARAQLSQLSGNRHSLLSAAVIYENANPVWRHVGQVRLQMHKLSGGYLDDYIGRNWASIRRSVGAYKLEEEGARLFHGIDGDYFTVLGLPLLELLSYLALKGILPR